MYAAGSGGTEDAAASVDIPRDGFITGIEWDANADLDADTERFRAELSFIATNQFATNDVRGRISSVSVQISLTTSGIATAFLQKWVGPLNLRVAGGERLYLHLFGTSGLASEARCNVHLDTGTGAERRSARRR